MRGSPRKKGGAKKGTARIDAGFLSYAQGLAVTSDGGVIATGGYGDFNVMNYLPTGQPDPSFGPDHDGYAGIDLIGTGCGPRRSPRAPFMSIALLREHVR